MFYLSIRLKYLGEKDGKMTFELGANKMVINSEPLRLDFLINDEPVTSLNAQGLLKFEHTRAKKQ